MILLSLLGFSLVILLGLTLVFLRNWLYIESIHDGVFDVHDRENPLVSICIPARNEELNINACVRSALNQTYTNCEVLVLDDESDDDTPAILQSLQEQADRTLHILRGSKKPSDWLGKNWACSQLANQAKGDILLFIDADVTLEPHTIDALVQRFSGQPNIGLISVWPQQVLVSFWENVLVPMVYYTLFGFLFLRYTEQPPRWMPSFIRKKMWPLFAASCGQFMAFRRSVYEQIGGHESVKNMVVEDVELARLCLKQQIAVQNLSGKDAVYCRMYRSYPEIFQGFRKNFLSGFGNSLSLFLLAALMHLSVFILPFVLMIYYIGHQFWPGFIISYCMVMIPIFHRYLLHLHFEWKIRYIFSHILGVLWFQWLGIWVISDRIRGKKSNWKGRSV